GSQRTAARGSTSARTDAPSQAGRSSDANGSQNQNPAHPEQMVHAHGGDRVRAKRLEANYVVVHNHGLARGRPAAVVSVDVGDQARRFLPEVIRRQAEAGGQAMPQES